MADATKAAKVTKAAKTGGQKQKSAPGGAAVPPGVGAFTHVGERRLNLPTPELARVAREGDLRPILASYRMRDADLDPQLVWRGKYEGQDMESGDLMVTAAPIYTQEKVHPKYLVDDLMAETAARARANALAAHAGQGIKGAPAPGHASLFSDFNGMAEGADRTEFYRHEQNWANRLVLGDSLQVMAGLLEREAYAGKVQCIYFDPPYGIRFNSNFQWSVTSRDVKDGRADHVSREAEVVKAFRDTWRDGVHSYLGYIRDRLLLARRLLAEGGSIFVQIGDENVHRVRAVMDEVFGEENFVSQIVDRKTTSEGGNLLGTTCDFILWYAKDRQSCKVRKLFAVRSDESDERYNSEYVDGTKYRLDNLISSRPAGDGDVTMFRWFGIDHSPGKGTFKTTESGLNRIGKADRLQLTRNNQLSYRRFKSDFGFGAISNLWTDISGAVQSRSDPKIYVVQTSTSILTRCLLLTTDPGDLVLDPTCGSGTTAYVAEQWGRRWIAIDTSRVAVALARTRLMGARYPYYLLRDSPEGRAREVQIAPMAQTAQASAAPSDRPPCGNRLREGFVYELVPHVTLKSIANNPDIDAIWEKWQGKIGPALAALNNAVKADGGAQWQEWQVPLAADGAWPAEAKRLHAAFLEARLARQREIDASIAARAESETLYDRPFQDPKRVRVAGPFTVESTSPSRQAPVGEDGHVLDHADMPEGPDFARIIMEELRAAGVQGVTRDARIAFDSLMPWPGRYVAAEGRYRQGGENGECRRAAVFIGSEFATVQRQDLVEAAAEAADGKFTELLACAFHYAPECADLTAIGRMPILKARMNSELHMSQDLKSDGKGNLFVIFGEPDVAIEEAGEDQEDQEGQAGGIRVRIRGVDVYDAVSGDVRSDDLDGVACWLIDTDYNGECFFVRHAYFLGADPHFDGLKRSLKAEIDREAWESLRSDVSRPFPRPSTGRIAVKVINHFGDEVMKVYRA
jgi:adenine-specific DNA-methyltransferase